MLMLDDQGNHYSIMKLEDGKLVVVREEDQKTYDMDTVRFLPMNVRQAYIARSIDTCSKKFYDGCK